VRIQGQDQTLAPAPKPTGDRQLRALIFHPTRDEVREFLFDACAPGTVADSRWPGSKRRRAHPRRCCTRNTTAVLDDPAALPREAYVPGTARPTPSCTCRCTSRIEEQLSIDHPAGVRAAFARLLERSADRHAALHAAIDCVAEMVWRAQRDGTPPDPDAYLDCLAKQAQQ
jgi:hypothetical protein